jgi:hypothetical protein
MGAHLRAQPWFKVPGHTVVSDALSATFLSREVDTVMSFSRSDFDTLLPPWRTVIEVCVRSRLALSMMSAWPRSAEDLWPAVDAALD